MPLVPLLCREKPTAQAAVIAYPDFVMLDFSGTDGDFQFSEQERTEIVNIGVSVFKGNTVLKDAINDVLGKMDVNDFNSIMEDAIRIQPMSEE